VLSSVCPGHVSCMVNIINTTTELQYELTSITNWKLSDDWMEQSAEYCLVCWLFAHEIWHSDLRHNLTYPRLFASRQSLADFYIGLILLYCAKLMQDNKVSHNSHKLLECEDPRLNWVTRIQSKSPIKETDILMKLKESQQTNVSPMFVLVSFFYIMRKLCTHDKTTSRKYHFYNTNCWNGETEIKFGDKKPVNKITHHIGDKHSDKTGDRGKLIRNVTGWVG